MVDPWREAEAWLTEKALPLWSGPGLDSTRGVWEELDLAGRPRRDLPKRLRVQARQVHVFATAAALGYGTGYRDRAESVFAFLTDRGFDWQAGAFVHLLDPDGQVRDRRQDLYDLAFVLLALAALVRAGRGDLTLPWLPTWDAALAAHRAQDGWLETPAPGTFPRRQNPHMHLLEATLAAYEATGAVRFRVMADECLALFRDRFLDPGTGLLLEYFEHDWTPVAAERQHIEPGHMMEWIFLLAEYTRVTDRTHGIDLRAIFDRAYAIGSIEGEPFLRDALRPTGEPLTETRRFWPQIELLRASLTLTAAGEPLLAALRPEALLSGPFRTYLATPTAGGWHDRFSIDGKLLSASMPASTLYHVFDALRLGLA